MNLKRRGTAFQRDALTGRDQVILAPNVDLKRRLPQPSYTGCERPVAWQVGQRFRAQILFPQRRQDSDHREPAGVFACRFIHRCHRVIELTMQTRERAACDLERVQVVFEIEAVDLELQLGVERVGQHAAIKRQRQTSLVDDRDFQLCADRRRPYAKTRASHKLPQHPQALLKALRK